MEKTNISLFSEQDVYIHHICNNSLYYNKALSVSHMGCSSPSVKPFSIPLFESVTHGC